MEVALSQEIRAAADAIGADVAVKTASLETRVDTSRHGDASYEALGAVRREVAFGRWYSALKPKAAALVLDIIVRDMGLTRAAAAHGVGAVRARRWLSETLAVWGKIHLSVRKEITEADLLAAQAGLF